MSITDHPMKPWAEANKPHPACVILYPNRIGVGIRAAYRIPPVPLIYALPEDLTRGALAVTRSDSAIKVSKGEMSFDEYRALFPIPTQR